MLGRTTKIKAHDGVALDCYVALPPGNGKAPAIVMSSGAFGVTPGFIEICDYWAAKGFLVAAPEQWQRGDKGPIAMGDEGRKRATARIQGPAIFESVTKDLKSTLDFMHANPRCNGKTAIMGYCFGGPFAVVGVLELGCSAGGSYHGSNFGNQIENLKKTTAPLQLHWGDKDFALSPELLGQVRAAAVPNKSCEIFIYPGIEHGYTGRESTAFNTAAVDSSWQRTATMMDRLK